MVVVVEEDHRLPRLPVIIAAPRDRTKTFMLEQEDETLTTTAMILFVLHRARLQKRSKILDLSPLGTSLILHE